MKNRIKFTRFIVFTVALLACMAWSLREPAVTRAAFADLHDFDSRAPQSGAYPQGNLTAVGAALYGMTTLGGPSGYGAIFEVNSDGTGYQVLHSFTGGASADGACPYGSLTLSGSTLYGLTSLGGAFSHGAIFKINTDGTGYQVFYSFSGGTSDGAGPNGSLTLSGSTLYGLTSLGGASGYGTIFKINTDGTGYQVLYSFGGGTSDGAHPDGALILSGATLYAMTSAGGGTPGYGTVFKINTDGTGYQVLYSFGGAANDGKVPYGDLTLSGSTLYGMTNYGGADGQGDIFELATDGTGYRILHSFGGGVTDGALPYGNLTLAGDWLYGETLYGGASGGYGTLFKINTDGAGYQLLYSFSDGATDGASPYGALILSGSTFYGMTSLGGANNSGTIYAWEGALWQNAVSTGNGWYYMDWLHSFYIDPSGWIYQQQLGWLYPQGTSTDSVWFYDPTMNSWLWTSDTAFPTLYRASDNTWLWYGEWGANPCYFYNYTTNKWETY